MEAIQEDLQSIFGTVAIFVISIAVVLAIIAVVLLEICWVLRLCSELHRRWKARFRQIGDQDGSRSKSPEYH
jgi:hypothetical protein